ncbi:MAG: sensor histidine kinase [Gemmataceae bacterium]
MRGPALAGSLLLVAGCIIAALYLNYAHREVSTVLTENVASIVADKELETTLDELPLLLRGDHSRPELLASELAKQHEKADPLLDNVRRSANTNKEIEYVNKIESSWQDYKKQFSKRPSLASGKELVEFDRQLALHLAKGVLMDCSRLLEYNTRQVRDSNDAARRLVDQMTFWLLAVGIGAPLSGWLLGYAMARRLYQSMLQLSVRIRDAAGRLNSELRPVTLERNGAATPSSALMQGIAEQIEHIFARLHQSEREVVRAEQLAAVGQVAAGVAHELRNPLTSVKMLVQTGMEGDPPAGLPAEDLGIIEHEIRRMETCIQSFLDFARPPSAERRPTDLLAVIRRSVALIEGRARRQNVAIKTDLPPGPLELLLDPEQIHQVLVNLMLNALEAMPHGGEVRLEARELQDPPRVQVRLHDTGPGISAAIQARLFEPFVSNKETGLGLGLSICRRLLEAQGGTIRGENDPSGGAAFTFTLKIKDD